MEGKNNGGFPEPPAGAAVRLVRCEHAACGAATRVRLPQVLPATVVRHVVCDTCREPFECDQTFDVGVAHPLTPRPAQVPGGPLTPHGHAWRYVGVPVAAAAVGGALAVIQRLG
ncbi:MAG: hypothetical protein AABM66_06820 [Actinomycetota bacterium]